YQQQQHAGVDDESSAANQREERELLEHWPACGQPSKRLSAILDSTSGGCWNVRNGIARYCRRFSSMRPRVTVSRMRPQVRDRKASNMMPVPRTAVGSRGTRPVLRYVMRIGTSRTTARIASTTQKKPKNCSGFSA